jgi:putative chitinase
MSMTIEILNKILNPNYRYSTDVLQKITDTLNQVFQKYEINTKLRVSHFLAQVLHESGGFRYKAEIASGAAYEGRKDLGNIQVGDGKRFKGYGWIQITGRANQTIVCKLLNIPLAENSKLGEYPYCGLSAGWFWDTHHLNLLADKDDIDTISDLVNLGHHTIKFGDANGFADRKMWLDKCKQNIL